MERFFTSSLVILFIIYSSVYAGEKLNSMESELFRFPSIQRIEDTMLVISVAGAGLNEPMGN